MEPNNKRNTASTLNKSILKYDKNITKNNQKITHHFEYRFV